MIINKLKKRMSKIYMSLIFTRHEKIYKTEKCKISYLFIPNKKSKKLLIVFSGFSESNQPAVYNYVRKFNGTNINRLYVLDNFGYDKRGAYYLGKKNDFFIESAVESLISKISVENGIKKEDIITSGSSKGGYAALYFGFKYDYGEIIAGAPQTLLGNYLILSKTYETLRYIGGENKEEACKYLNSILYDVVKNRGNSKQPKIRIHIGKGDHHYKKQVLPFVKYLDENNLSYDLDIADYTEHVEVGTYFPPFALKYINDN